MEKKQSFFKKSLKIYIFLLVLLTTFLGGLLVGAWKINSVPPFQVTTSVFNKSTSALIGKKVDFNIFWQAWKIIQEKYVNRPVAEEDLLYGALAGLAASLGDPYTIFFDPDTTRAFNQEISGTFEGIGIEIGMKKNQLVVIAPLPDSPADKVGLLAGDKIIRIDNIDTWGITIDSAVSLIRGEQGTIVDLLIEREETEEPISFSIARDIIKIQTVSWNMIEDQYAYLKISHFNEETAKSFQKTVREINLKEPPGIILDLRNNPGGFLDVAIKITSSFIPQGQVIVIEDFGNGNREEYQATNETVLLDYPLVVLVNEGSASASEILAGALQDYKIAPVIGEQTFGKGLVQELEEFSDGSSLKISVAEWLTPNGRSIDQEGIKPDVIVELTQDDYDNNLDPQLDRAISILKEKIEKK